MVTNISYLHSRPLKAIFNLLFITLTLFISIIGINNAAFAQQTAIIPFEKLDEVLQDGFTLKHVKAYKEVYFTKPQNWRILGGSSLVVKFHHSAELIPARSHLSIFINGKLVKKESLDKSSVEIKTISVPVPLAGLGNYNTIRFEVEQHYTDHCEDPLDPSLWTYIHENTHLNLKYAIVQPKVNLADYPYPLYDPYAYGSTDINYIVAKAGEDNKISQSINGLGIIAADIAQKISWHDLKYMVTGSDKDLNNNLNAVMVGSPIEIPLIKKYAAKYIKNIDGTPTVIEDDGTPLADSEGLIYFINNPQNTNRAILIVTGNAAEGINKAASYLSNESTVERLKGNRYIVKDYNPPKKQPTTIAKYIHNKGLTFKQMGFETERAERIGPLPLEYPIRIIPDMKTSSGELTLNLVYSYSPDINPELSSIEVKFNDVSLNGAIIDNPKGVTNKTLKVVVPDQYVKPYNVLKVQFHLFPSKFGYCVDDYEDDIWGEISTDSSVSIPSDAKIVFPDLGLFNDQLYPYTTLQDLSNAVIITSDTPSIKEYQALLNVIGSIAKVTTSDAGIDLITTSVSDVDNYNISDRNVILTGAMESNSYIDSLRSKLALTFDEAYKVFTPYSSKNNQAILAYDKNQGLVQQIISTLNPNKIITVFYGKTDEASRIASLAISDKKKLRKINEGSFYTVDNNFIRNILIKDEASKKSKISSARAGKVNEYWPPSGPLGWIAVICMGFIVLVLVLVVLRVLINILFGRKGS
jgi:hypothetical protein